MTYSTFLGLFLGVPLVAMAALSWRDLQRGRSLTHPSDIPRPSWVLLIHALLALAYTSPWDNYLVANRVWWYDPARVLGVRLGWVPLEEYAFFVLQALLTGLWLLWLARRYQPAPLPAPERSNLRSGASLLAGLLWLAATALVLTHWGPVTYLGLELAWALPPLLLQLCFGADILLHRWRVVLPALVVPSLYLATADALAIASGTWTINPARSLGLLLAGVLPVEELGFFLLTNTLIVSGMTLGLAPESWQRLRCWWRWLRPPGAPASPHPACGAQERSRRQPHPIHQAFHRRHVIVIGAGLGGLAVAARLARAGCRVTVFDKQDRPGGRLGLIQHRGFRFDTGATLYLMPETFEQTFADLGRRRADYYDLLKVDPNYRLHYHDGSSVVLSTDLVHMQRELERLEPGVFPRYLAFLAEGGRRYDTSVRRFLNRDFPSLFDFLAPAHLPLLVQLRVFQRHYARAAHYFRSEKLRQAMTFQTMYLGSSPFDALATYTLLQYADLARGVYLPRGGMYAIAQAFVQILAEEGAELHCSAPVKRIALAGRRVVGVQLEDGACVPADAVVANADLPYVYDQLLDDPVAARMARHLKRREYTCSAVMFYWGLDRRYERELPIHHNIFLAADYRGSFEQIFRHYHPPIDPSFYISAAVRTDPASAPPGQEAWVVLVPVGHLEEGVPVDWNEQSERIRAHVLRRLAEVGVPRVQEHIVFEQCYTPRYYSDGLNLTKGSAFGLAHNIRQVGYFRPHNKAQRFKGLYFVGANTHPGTGLPLVLISARLTAERLLTGG